MSWPPPREPVYFCTFSVCRTTVALRSWVRAELTLNLPIVDHEVWPTIRERVDTTVLEADEMETWLCIHHTELVRTAKKRGQTIRRSVEGWLWIDELDHMRFSV